MYSTTRFNFMATPKTVVIGLKSSMRNESRAIGAQQATFAILQESIFSKDSLGIHPSLDESRLFEVRV
jgi:hypothetical protein